MAMEGKKCCGFPRKRVAWCGLLTLVVAAIVTAVLVVTLKPPDDIETIEQDGDSANSATTAGDLTILSTAALSSDTGGEVDGTLSLLQVTNDSSYFLALNDFSTASDCAELEVRLLSATSTSAAGGLVVVPVTADTATTSDFTEELVADFDPDLYGQVRTWGGDSLMISAVVVSGLQVAGEITALVGSREWAALVSSSCTPTLTSK